MVAVEGFGRGALLRSTAVCYAPAMRTTIICLCLALSVPTWADPSARSEAAKLGYSEDILKQLPDKHLPRAPNPDWQPIRPHTEQRTPDRNLLAPRLDQKAEPASMLPYLTELHKKNPKSPKITRKLALTCLKAGQPREALYWFTQTWFRDRTDLAALWNCAALSYRLGDYRATSNYLKEYAQRDPHSVWGRIAREMQDATPYGGGSDLGAGFAGRLPRGGVMTGGTGKGAGTALMIIGGKEMEIPRGDTFADRLDEEAGAKTPVKAKSGPAAEPLPAKTSLRRAVIEPPAAAPAQPAAPPPHEAAPPAPAPAPATPAPPASPAAEAPAPAAAPAAAPANP